MKKEIIIERINIIDKLKNRITTYPVFNINNDI